MARQKAKISVPPAIVPRARPSVKRALQPGSETARQEGEATRAEAQRLLDEAVAKQAAAAAQAKQDQITDFRKQLGIDDLIKTFQDQMAQYQQAFTSSASPDAQSQPSITLPSFDFSGVQSYLDKYIAGLTANTQTPIQSPVSAAKNLPEAPKPIAKAVSQVPTPATTPKTPVTPTIQAPISPTLTNVEKASNKVVVGGKTYNLAAAGGAGFSKADIEMLKNKGLSTSQIIKAASQSSTIPTEAAQKTLGIKATEKADGGFEIVSAKQKSGDTKDQPKQPVFFATPQAVAQQVSKSETKKDQPKQPVFFATPQAVTQQVSKSGGSKKK